MNAGKFIDFLKALLGSVPGKIFLIVDGHPVHKAKKVSEFVKEKADGRLSIFFLPPYSPDLNPDEWVWNNVKNDRIGRGVIMSADDLKAKAIGALRRLQKLPDIVRGFLRDPKLAYILELHRRTAREVYKLIFSLVTRRGQRIACPGAGQAGACRSWIPGSPRGGHVPGGLACAQVPGVPQPGSDGFLQRGQHRPGSRAGPGQRRRAAPSPASPAAR